MGGLAEEVVTRVQAHIGDENGDKYVVCSRAVLVHSVHCPFATARLAGHRCFLYSELCRAQLDSGLVRSCTGGLFFVHSCVCICYCAWEWSHSAHHVVRRRSNDALSRRLLTGLPAVAYAFAIRFGWSTTPTGSTRAVPLDTFTMFITTSKFTLF